MPRRRRFRPNYPLLCAIGIFLGAIGLYIGSGVLSAVGSSRWAPGGSLYLALVARSLDATVAVWFFAVGASIGSFLNVVAYRLPLGKTLGGHSACPFCATRIASSDNIPVLAWLRLRGRCRTCRLPIAVQYPLVELGVGLVFLAVYFLEFGIAGSNLPGSPPRPPGMGLVWMSVSGTLSVRVLLYLYMISGLIAAALMRIRHSRPPLSLFAWVAAVLVAVPFVYPPAIILGWSGFQDPVTTQVDVLITLACGLVVALTLGAVLLPLMHRGGNTEIIGWMGTLACLGLLVGWQALPLAVAFVLLVACIGPAMTAAAVPAARANAGLFDPVCWAWLGVLLFRATWKQSHGWLERLPGMPHWVAAFVPVALCIPLAWWIGTRSAERKLETEDMASMPTAAVESDEFGASA